MHEAHGGHSDDPMTMKVSITLAILAVLVAGVTLLGHRASTDIGSLQTQTANQWAFYQAKNVRSKLLQVGSDILSVATVTDKEKAASMAEGYKKEVERYEGEMEKISEQAKEYQHELETIRRRADRFDAGEGFLEFGLILCSITLLTKKNAFWFSGMLLAAVGIGVAATGFLVH